MATHKDELRKWAGEVASLKLKYIALKYSTESAAHSHSGEQTAWAWPASVSRQMAHPDKETVWQTHWGRVVLLRSFYLSLFSWLSLATSLSECFTHYVFGGMGLGKWRWPTRTNPSINTLPLCSSLGGCSTIASSVSCTHLPYPHITCFSLFQGKCHYLNLSRSNLLQNKTKRNKTNKQTKTCTPRSEVERVSLLCALIL